MQWSDAYFAVLVEGCEFVRELIEIVCEAVGGQILEHVFKRFRESAKHRQSSHNLRCGNASQTAEANLFTRNTYHTAGADIL